MALVPVPLGSGSHPSRSGVTVQIDLAFKSIAMGPCTIDCNRAPFETIVVIVGRRLKSEPGNEASYYEVQYQYQMTIIVLRQTPAFVASEGIASQRR